MEKSAGPGPGGRTLWLVLVVASATLTTAYLLDGNGAQMPSQLCWILFVAAWLTVLVAWRQQRQVLSRWNRGLSILLFWIAIPIALFAFGVGLAPQPQPTPADVDYFRLRDAIVKQDQATVRGMLTRGVDPGHVVWDYRLQPAGGDSDVGTSLVDIAIRSNNQDALRLLLRKHAALHEPVDYRGDPLASVMQTSDNAAMLRLLVQSGIAVNDSSGNSPALWSAVENNRLESVLFLLHAGANPNSLGDSNGYLNTPDGRMSVIHLARLQQYMDIAAHLKNAGAAD